jgi:ElaB/YqjD/DUF883 family membrane-anchored ribosome-binding protein
MPQAAHKLMTDLSEDYEIVVAALGRMTKNIGDHGDEAVTESAQQFVHSAAAFADNLKRQSASVAERAGEEVREHPIAAAALAAAAVGLLGYAAGQATKRR